MRDGPHRDGDPVRRPVRPNTGAWPDAMTTSVCGAMLDWTTANREVLQLMVEDETSRYRIIDTAGSEVAIVALDVTMVDEGSSLTVPGLGEVMIVEVYDDEDGREGGVAATIVVEEP